jgi:hypothetical protein
VRNWLGRFFRSTPSLLDDDRWRALLARAPWLASGDPALDSRLRELIAGFHAGKTITALQGLELDGAQRDLLAALACLPLRRFGVEGLRRWSQVLVYPEAFRVRRSEHDEDSAVVHEWEDELSGESWEHGPLILSWADVEAELEAPREGYGLVVHEMAHKLDALDGAMDGTPPLPAEWQRQWARDFSSAYAALCTRVDAGEDTEVDPYATQSPEEFFAVASELHFSAPELLRAAMPAVATHLERFYGPSPFSD